MKKVLLAGLLVLCTLFETACSPIEVIARDGLAGSKAAILTLASVHPECAGGQTSPPVCKAITDAVVAHNATTIALNAYCEGTPAPGIPSYDQGGSCVPIKNLNDALKTALVNLKSFTDALKGFK